MSSDSGTATAANHASGAATRLRIGVIAPQFPPGVGGMQELAFGMATGLARFDDVCVYTLPDQGVSDAPFQQKPTLSKRDLDANLRTLRDEPVDVWCAMDAGLALLAPHLRQPFFAYFHGNDFLSPAYGFRAEWSRLLAGRPLVWKYAKRLARIERHRAMARSLPHVREIFTNSRSTAGLIDRTFPGHGRRVTVIPPGVSDEFFQPRAGGAGHELRLLTISRLTRHSKRKNVDGVLRALQLLRTESPELRFTYTIVGDGNDRERLERMSGELGLAEFVRFLGFVTREQLLAALRDADLMVLAPKASRHDVEGFGMVYIEASASGVPVLASAAGGAVDAIADGINGILIDSSDPAAIAGGIRRFAAQRAAFTPEAAQAFAERFRWPAVSAALRSGIASGVSQR